jgi:signal transduction histidine kinase
MDAYENGYSDHLIKDIEVIRKHSIRIGTIARGILAFSKKSPVEFSLTDINEIIDETLLLLEKQFSQNNIHFNKNMDNSIPKVYGNSNQLQQVFFNIFYNARDAMPGGGEIRISSQYNDNRGVSILISDSGIGIPEENLNRVFDPFFTTKEDEKGTGLGLSVVYGIIRSHNGEINVTSKVGEGTTFEIQLPLKHNLSEEV